MITIAWIAATVWAHRTGRNQAPYFVAALFSTFLEIMGLIAWLTN